MPLTHDPEISVLTVDQLVRTAAARWYARHGPRPYREEGWSSPDAEARHEQLLALGSNPDRQAVEALLGKGWVTHRCTLCYRAAERVAHLAFYDLPIDLCQRCIAVAHQLVQGSTLIHPMVDMAEDAVIGEGTRVWAFAVIGPDVVIGRNCVVGAAAHVMPGARLGDEVRVQSHCFICEGAMVGNRVFFGVGVKLSADKYPHVGKTDYVPVPPIIEDGVSLGTDSIILPGVRLGAGCLIGAGAVVTKSVPPHEVWIGVPAKRWRGIEDTPMLREALGIDPETYYRGCGLTTTEDLRMAKGKGKGKTPTHPTKPVPKGRSS